MNRSEALEFFNAAYRRGMEWIDALRWEHEEIRTQYRNDMNSRRPYRHSAVDVLSAECAVDDARDIHRETMAMIVWEVCGPAFEQGAA